MADTILTVLLFCTRPLSSGVNLTHVKEFCLGMDESVSCATISNDFVLEGEHDIAPVSLDDVAVGIKTCSKFHDTRLNNLIQNWGYSAKHITYYSDRADDTIPTVDIGVPNTETGHCAKLEAILRRLATDYPDKSWYLIADDDTKMDLEALTRVLGQYGPDEPIILGERSACRAILMWYCTGCFSHPVSFQIRLWSCQGLWI